MTKAIMMSGIVGMSLLIQAEVPDGIQLRDRATGQICTVYVENGNFCCKEECAPCAEPGHFRVDSVASLLKAIDAATPGSEIVVAPGEYACNVKITKCPVKLISEQGPGNTTLKGVDTESSVVQISDGAKGTLLKGFTLMNGAGRAFPSSYGHDYYGGGAHCSVPCTIEDCRIIGNGRRGPARHGSATFGGGILVGADPVVVRNCELTANFAWASGGAILVDGDKSRLILENSTVTNNMSTQFFGCQGGVSLANGGQAELNGVVLNGNQGDQVGAFGRPYNKGTGMKLRNCSIEGGVRAGGIEHFEVIETKESQHE